MVLFRWLGNGLITGEIKMTEKLSHKYKVGQEMSLPGARIRSQHYVNQFAYNKTGVIEKLGHSRQVFNVKDKKVFGEDGISFHWSYKSVHLPRYFVKGRWYEEGKKSYGVTKL